MPEGLSRKRHRARGAALRETGCEDTCMGCAHRDLTKQESLEKKQKWVERELEKKAHPVKASIIRWRYRTKVTLRARFEQSWQFGFVQYRGKEEIFLPIPHCPLHSTEVNAVLSWVRPLDSRLPIFSVVVSPQSLVIVLKEKKNPLSLGLLQHFPFPNHFDVFVNWNPVAGKRTLQYGQTEVIHRAVRSNASEKNRSTLFRQQITHLHEESLQKAKDFLFSGLPVARIVDWYSGSGNSLGLWQDFLPTIGVELSGDAVELAKIRAPKAIVLAGRVEDRLPQVEEFVGSETFGLYTNPSRAGHSAKALEWIEKMGPQKVAYLSCHPRSLAGDLRALRSYEVIKIQPYDFFPQTDQVETLVLLQKI